MSIAETQEMTDDSGPGRYFAMMLHIDDDDLDPFEYKLLGHYRKICGLSKTKTCYESLETTAANAKMSVAKAREARNELEKKGCIKTRRLDGQSVFVNVIDRMAENVRRFSDSGNPYRIHEGGAIESDRGGLSNPIPKKEVKEDKNNTSLQDVEKSTPADGDPLGDEIDNVKPSQPLEKAKQNQATANLAQRESESPNPQVPAAPLPPLDDYIWAVGEKAYYAHQGGWGGGETKRAVALVVALHKTKISIVVFNERKKALQELTVSASNLTPRDTEHEQDKAFEDHLTQRQKPKPRVDQPLQDAIAIELQGIDKELATSLTGVLAQKAAGTWRKRLKKDKLTADEYAAAARSISPFIQWFRKECEGCALPTSPDTFESRYAQFVSVTVNGKPASSAEPEYVDDPEHPGAKITPAQLKLYERRKEREAAYGL